LQFSHIFLFENATTACSGTHVWHLEGNINLRKLTNVVLTFFGCAISSQQFAHFWLSTSQILLPNYSCYQFSIMKLIAV